MLKDLSIGKIGVDFNGNAMDKDVIYRVKKKPLAPTWYYYLVVPEDHSDLSDADILVVKDIRRTIDTIGKKARKGLGLEVLISDMRAKEGISVARWFKEIRRLQKFCNSTGSQLIISSGAASVTEMVSGVCFDSILENCEIEPNYYWHSINRWLEDKMLSRVIADAK